MVGVIIPPVTGVDEEDDGINCREVILPHSASLVVTTKIECGEPARVVEGDPTYLDHIDKTRNGINSSKGIEALEWPDPVDAELLRGGMQGGHVLSHPVILEHVKQGGFACIVQPWKEYFQFKVQVWYDEDSESHLGKEVFQTSSKVRGNPKRPWTNPRETSCQLSQVSLSLNITSYL